MWFRASKHDLENQKDLSRDTEELSYDEVLKQIQYDILQLQVEMESLKKRNYTEYDYDESATYISIRKQGSQNQEIDTNDISQRNVLAKQEHQQNEDIISINDIESIIQSLQSNQEFHNYLGGIVQEKVHTSFFDLVQGQAQTTQQTNLTPITRTSSLTGIASSSTRKGQFEEDFYSMMMLSIVRSRVWLFGIICFIMQMTLAAIIIIEQTQNKFLETDMRIPIKVSILPRIAQMLAIILAIMTQNEFLMGIRTIMMLPYKDKSRWGSIIDIDVDKCTKMRWFQHIFLPNCLKSVQGGMVLVASFIVIVQIDTTVDVLKDYSALFVVSSVDNLFFNFADMGYLGEKLSKKAEKMKKIKLDENERGVWKILAALLVTLITAFMTTYVYIMVGQANGKYVKQAYPICPVDEKIENEGETFLDIIGDGTCQFPQGQGTNIIECGWDGRDCEIINERFPKCFVDDFSLLGDGNCETGIYNTEACGFDNGDCFDSNTQKEERNPNCNVENIGWIGDGNCNGGDYASDDCENDGGDCTNCAVNDIKLVGDGNCNDGVYNSKGCSFDGEDCIDFNKQNQIRYPNCNVENIGWVGDGICNGGKYASDDCENDGGDCANCAVNDMNLVGDGNCNDGVYNSKGCSFDGGDCTDFNKQRKKERYPNCNVENIGWVGDGICNGGKYASDDCENDGGDCTGCIVDNIDLVGDGKCNGSVYNSDGCSYDGGDCTEFNQQNQIRYPNCNVENIGWVGDGICNGGKYSSDDCENDAGECANCVVDNIDLVGDGTCDGSLYNKKACGFDGGDCTEFNQQNQIRYPNCNVENIGWVGDGICNGGDYAFAACESDGGDCSNCAVNDIKLVGDGTCDGSLYNKKTCGFDGGDCTEFNQQNQIRYPNCNVENIGWIGDGICNGGECASDDCENDGGDCANCAVNDINLVGDGNCDGSVYNSKGCSFDGGDCTEFNKLNQEKFLNCNVENIGWVGDGICNGGEYASDNCEIDGGDCANCAVNDMNLVGDGNCDGSAYNSIGCSFDGGDCIDFNQQKSERYPNCNVENTGWIEDGFCDEENNFDNCLFDGNDCVPALELVGDKHRIVEGWVGGVLGHDGNIYGIPYRATRILKIDPIPNATSDLGDENSFSNLFNEDAFNITNITNTFLRKDKLTALVGNTFRETKAKWFGGVVGNDGIIYGVPYDIKSILSYNITSKETKLIAEGHSLLTSNSKFSGGVLANNGMIYFTPNNHNKVIKFDPSNSTNPLTEIGDDLGDEGDKMRGGVLGSDGNIYAIPYSGTRVLKINIGDDTTSFLGDEYPDSRKWMNGVLAKDGNIYACPFGANQILQINIETQTTYFVEVDLGNSASEWTFDDAKWSGFVEGEDGFLYGIPFRSNDLLRFDPISHTATLIPLPREWNRGGKWEGGVRAENGFIYAIPRNADQVLSVAPVKVRP